MSQRAIKLPKPSPQRQRHIMVTVFTETERRGWVNPRLVTSVLRLAFDQRFRLTYTPIHAVHPVDAARNLAVETFLKSDAEILVFFDNDVYAPGNFGDAVASMPAECDIAVMPYWVFGPDNFTMPCFGHWQDGMMVAPDPAT